MFDPMSDETDIMRARSRYNARKTESSLIAWICSDTWAHVIQDHPKDAAQNRRGAYMRTGMRSWRRSDDMSGEIDNLDLAHSADCECCNAK